MEHVKVCHICLIMDVKMYDLQSYPLNTYFEPITGRNLLRIVNSPPHACFECALLVKKYYFFRQKCLRSQDILYGLIDHSGKIVPEDIKHIDRDGLVLSSNLAPYTAVGISTQTSFESKTPIKEEQDGEDVQNECDAEESGIKEEDDYEILSPERSLSSDEDDEPLSLHKEKKIKECKENQVKEDQDHVLKLEPAEEETCDELPTKRKRGRAKKLKVPKKTIKPNGKTVGRKTFSENIELGDYITVINLSMEEQMEEINKRKESSNYLNSPFQCNLCYKGFIDTHAWKHHVGKHSPNAGDIECPICKFRFKTKRALQKHSSNHEKKYACKSCPYISSNTTQAKQHQGWHKGVTYKCKYCDDIFTVWTSYMSHVRIKHPSEFICGICGYSYISKLGLTMHKTMMHKDVMEKGEDVVKEGPYCEDCDVKFVSMEAFKRHMVMSTKHTRTTKTMMPGQKLSEQEKKERKRLCERRRKARIKNDPLLREEHLRKDRERLAKRKAAGLILSRSQMTTHARRVAQKNNRISARAYYQRKKAKATAARNKNSRTSVPLTDGVMFAL